ncbi:MAG: hypothetical protein AB1560_09010 [Pseudomonadota bacterium]
MTPYRIVMPNSSGLFETCARHTNRQTARALQAIYLCDECTKRLVSEAFNNRPPVYHGETIQGFCGLCNLNCDVTMRQWFVCPICWNVVLAYQKSIAASVAIHEWWANTIKPKFPELELVETEPVYLSPFARGVKTKKQGAATLSLLDFRVSDNRKNPPVPLFNIEQKTGPGAIDEMSEFQLDVNDFNDIAGATNNTKLPSYIVHVQASQNYQFPTRQTVITGIWWTDLITLQAHQKRISKRRGEDKNAIYYDPAAFSPIATFSEELERKGYENLLAKLSKKPIPLL